MKIATFLTTLAGVAVALPGTAAIAQTAPTTVEPMIPAAGTVLDLSLIHI